LEVNVGFVAGLDIKSFITAPTPTVAAQGTTGAATWTYKLVAVKADGTKSAAGSAGSATNGNADLDETDFNHITWTDPTDPDFDHMEIWRTAVGTTPSTTGLIGTADAGEEEFDDIGLAGDAATPPATSTSGVGDAKGVTHLSGVVAQLGTVGGSVTIQMQGTVDGSYWVNDGSTLTTSGAVWTAAHKWAAVRAKMTALSGDAPTMTLIAVHDAVYG
jgi:hypothetical protein